MSTTDTDYLQKLFIDEAEPALERHSGGGIPKTYLFVDDSGNEIPGVLVSQETIFDATENDVREGKIFASGSGVATGTKFIPSYNTWHGVQVVPSGSSFVIKNRNQQIPYHDYTQLQSVICTFNTSLSDSVSANKVSIEDSVYEVLSTVAISKIVKDGDNTSIDFGIINNTDSPCLIRFFTYKEVY